IHAIDQRRSIGTAKQENISCIVRDSETIHPCRILLDGEQRPRTRLKVHVVWRRGSAFRAIVDDEVSIQRSRNIEHRSKLPRDALQAVLTMNDRQMTLDDWKRIEVNRELLP